MSIIKDVKDLYKKSPVKFIVGSAVVVIGLFVAWYVTIPIVVLIFLWKKFKKDDEKQKGTKKICSHCKTEIAWDASKCPSCHEKMTVWTADKKITATILVALFFIGVVSFGISSTKNINPPPSEVASVKEEKSNIEVCVESEYLIKRFLKAPATAEFPTCRNFVIEKLEDDQFKVRSYVDSQNSFGAQLRSQWTIIYHYTDNGTKTQLDLVVIDGETIIDTISE